MERVTSAVNVAFNKAPYIPQSRLNQPKSPPISLPLIVQERPLGSRCEEEVGRVVGGREYLPGKSIRWRIRTFSAFLSDEG
ncbi:MAG: hypothetical protein LQ351_005112 [Letrouitia transgressa]|nr:MAG: hypothetical protein LQ351_005112 [Letrouitia transgressa]